MLDAALADYFAVQNQIRELEMRKGQLSDTCRALYALCSKIPDMNSLSLSDAIRTVFKNTERSHTAVEVRGKLQEMGYDLSKHKNALASIHTALSRMVEADELRSVEDKERTALLAGENLKEVPPSTTALPEPKLGEDLSEWLRNISTRQTEKPPIPVPRITKEGK